MIKKFVYIFFAAIIFFNAQIKGETVDSVIWSAKMAESIMKRNPNYYKDWDYVTGTVLRGFKELFEATGDSIYYQYIKKTVDFVVTTSGTINGYKLSEYNIDEINEGRMVLFLYEKTGNKKYKIAADSLYKQLQEHPRTSEAGFWHKKRYPNQMWLDGLYMGSPFLVEYAKMFNITSDYEDGVRQAGLMEKHMRDSVTGLLYHGWDESREQDWADSITGCSPSFWGRAMGWYAIAVIEMLDCLPKDYAEYDSLVHIYQRLAKAIVVYQDSASGCWYQVLDQGGREGNYIEASATCMFVYTLAKAVRLGYIDSSYYDVAKKGYQGILDNFISKNTDGTINLEKTCATAGLGAGRDGTFDYYVNKTTIAVNDGKGLGPFIMASLEFEKQVVLIVDTIVIIDTTKNDTVNIDTTFHTKILHTKKQLRFAISPVNKSNIINIEIATDYNGYANLNIYDSFGRVLKTLYFPEIYGNVKQEVDMGKHMNGIYILSIQTKDIQKTIKVLLN